MSKFPEPADGTTVVVEVIDRRVSLFTAITRDDATGEQGNNPAANWHIGTDDPEVDPGTWDDWTQYAKAVHRLGEQIERA